MSELYRYYGAQKLRCGYTTGSCAAAAAKAAAQMLLSGQVVRTVNLLTPKGIPIQSDILFPQYTDTTASCAIRKDSGDDPDITNGMLIFAAVRRISSDIRIIGGTGIGTVTRPGLDQPVGASAINSVPRQMIADAVRPVMEAYQYGGGLLIEISAPEGTEIAKKTYNPHMGIEGGISILGTTGIVEPMSHTALIDTIRAEANMRYAEGYRHLLLTLGNYSRSFLQNEMPFALGKSVKCSNFIGDAIDIALSLGFRSVLIIGHLGKLVKLGAGIFNTHSMHADGRMEVLMSCGILAGTESRILKQLPNCATVDAAIDILNTGGNTDAVMNILAQRSEEYLNRRVRNSIPIAAVMFSDKHSLIVKTPSADMLIHQISEEYHG